jgi:hypothetical protein
MEDLIFNLDKILPSVGHSTDEGVIRITISDMNLNQKGVLYFEKVKVGFVRKPISMSSWACVDAKIEGLYEMGGDFTPLDILNRCQQLLSSPAGQDTVDTNNKPTEE